MICFLPRFFLGFFFFFLGSKSSTSLVDGDRGGGGLKKNGVGLGGPCPGGSNVGI